MNLKILIGIVATILSITLLGYKMLDEPSRLVQYGTFREAVQTERGAQLYDENCAGCHGVDGIALECYDAQGVLVACRGLPLKSLRLVCGDRPERLDEMGWAGTKHDFVYRTIAAGRGQMGAWSEIYGGALNGEALESVTQFVLSYESEDLCNPPPIGRYWPYSYAEFDAEWEAGDPVRGQILFEEVYACAGCHGGSDADASWAGTGPWLGNIVENVSQRIPDVEPEEYIYESILEPGVFVVPGYANGLMPQDYPNRMGINPEVTPQDMQDIIAFLMEQ